MGRRIDNHATMPPRHGLAAVELALLLPLILLIVIGCIDFGRFAHSFVAVTNAARAGAGFAAMHPPTQASLPQWNSSISDRVLQELDQTLTSHGLTNNDVTVTAAQIVETAQGSATRWRVTVTVTMPFQSIVAFPLLPQNVTLTRSTTMRGIR